MRKIFEFYLINDTSTCMKVINLLQNVYTNEDFWISHDALIHEDQQTSLLLALDSNECPLLNCFYKIPF